MHEVVLGKADVTAVDIAQRCAKASLSGAINNVTRRVNAVSLLLDRADVTR
jgi:hypothetical protein